MKFVPFDTYDHSTRCAMSDDWNHWVYNDILEKRSKYKFKCVNKKKVSPLPQFKIKEKNSYKNTLNSFYNPFLNKKHFSFGIKFNKN